MTDDKQANAAAAKAQRDAWITAHRLGQAVDLSEALEAKGAETTPPGWNATVRRLEQAGGNIFAAVDSLGIFPRAGDVLQDRVVATLVAGIERRFDKALGPIGRLLIGKRRRRAFLNNAAGFAYGNALTLLVVGVEAERERKSRGKVGHR